MLANLSVTSLDNLRVTSVPLAVVSIPSAPNIPNEIPPVLFNNTPSVEVLILAVFSVAPSGNSPFAVSLIVFVTTVSSASLVAISFPSTLAFPPSAVILTSAELSLPFNTTSGVVILSVAVTSLNVGLSLNPISSFPLPSVSFLVYLVITLSPT